MKVGKLYLENDLFNFKISKIIQNQIPKQIFIEALKNDRLWSRPVLEYKFSKYCFYPDIPGNALAWGSISKYLMGNLVFKSSTKRQFYYYTFIKPWKHYIPVERDFSDLERKYEWARSNMEEASFIAWNGYIQANNYIKKAYEHLISVILEKNNNR